MLYIKKAVWSQLFIVHGEDFKEYNKLNVYLILPFRQKSSF